MNVLVVNGSPKGRRGATHALAALLGERLVAHGAKVEERGVLRSLRTEEATEGLLGAIDEADLVVLAFPLYVDCLPAPLTRLLELVGERRGGRDHRAQRLVALVQCGFPEARHCAVATRICRLFAERAGMRWAGALQMGMGGAVSGNGLPNLPGAADILRGLDLGAEALAKGEDIPAEAEELVARPLAPRWLYLAIGNFQWRWLAHKNGANRPLGHRAYAHR